MPHKTIRGMNINLSPRMESTSIEYPLKTKIRHKTQNVNAKHLRCQCIVSGRSISLIYISFSVDHSLKKLALKLRTIALPVYFMVLNFDYDIQLSIIHVSKCCLRLVSFYPSVVIFRGGNVWDRNRISPGYASLGDTLFRDT